MESKNNTLNKIYNNYKQLKQILFLKYNYNDKKWRQIIKNTNFDEVLHNGFKINDNTFLKTIKINL